MIRRPSFSHASVFRLLPLYSCRGSVYFPRVVVEGRQWWLALTTAQAL
jgi:hypothetical protein